MLLVVGFLQLYTPTHTDTRPPTHTQTHNLTPIHTPTLIHTPTAILAYDNDKHTKEEEDNKYLKLSDFWAVECGQKLFANQTITFLIAASLKDAIPFLTLYKFSANCIIFHSDYDGCCISLITEWSRVRS